MLRRCMCWTAFSTIILLMCLPDQQLASLPAMLAVAPWKLLQCWAGRAHMQSIHTQPLLTSCMWLQQERKHNTPPQRQLCSFTLHHSRFQITLCAPAQSVYKGCKALCVLQGWTFTQQTAALEAVQWCGVSSLLQDPSSVPIIIPA